MPTILNTYQNSSGNVGGLLGELTDALWGPKASAAAYTREKFQEAQRENTALEALAQSAQNTGRPIDLTDPTSLANSYRLGSRIAQFQNAQRGAVAARDASLNPTAQSVVGAGGSYAATPQAVRSAQDAQINLERQREKGRLALEQHRDDMALVDVVSPEGRVIKVPRSQVPNYMDQGYGGAPLSRDQVIGGVLQKALAGQPAAPAATTAQPAALPGPAAPAVSPFENLSPDLRHAAGLSTQNVSLWDPNTRQIYQSQDGGQTVLVLGQRIPVAGSGLQPVSNEQAVAQTQDNLTRQGLQPLPAAPVQPSRAALAAANTSGLGSLVQSEANRVAGIFNLGEFHPQVNADRNYLTNVVNQTRNILAAAPGRVSVQAQKWATEPFPQPNWLGVTGINAEEQQNNVLRTVQHLRDTYEMVRQEAMDPNLPPTERQKYASYLHGLGQVIQMWEAPPPASQAAPAAPAQPAQPSGPQAAPPVEGAQQAPDGNWYVEQNGKFFKVVQ